MKKIIVILVCLIMAITTVTGQNANLIKVKQTAYNAFRLELKAPSKFRLTNHYGDIIVVSQIPTRKIKGRIEIDTIIYSRHDKFNSKNIECDFENCKAFDYWHNEIKVDSIIVYKKTYKTCYLVKIEGDAMNEMGGYKHIEKSYFVYPSYSEYMIAYDEIYDKNKLKTIYACDDNDEEEKVNKVDGLEDKIFDVVEQQPTFPGGDPRVWIGNNIHYPPVAEENEMQGTVVCQFIVETNGSIGNVTVARGANPSLDKEAVRVVKSMPNWNPGKQNGRAVRVKYTLPVKFQL